MAESVEGAGFWLPSEFFDDFLTDNNNNTESNSDLFFPTEFPYDFETHNDDKRRVMSTSPQSTLAHMWGLSGRSAGGSSNSSPNGVASPPTTPLGVRNDALGDLIYRAAGQVAKLKLHGGGGPTTHDGFRGPPNPPTQLHPAPKNFNPSDLQKIHLQGCGMWHGEQQMYQNRGGRAVGGMGQDAWPIHQNPTRNIGSGRRVMLGGSGGGAAVKRECAGTGVFLPRRYGNNNNNNNDSNAYSTSDSRKRPGYSASLVPNRNGHALNKNFGRTNGFAQPQPQFQPNFDRVLVPDYDLLMARRNALMLQHQHQHRLLERSSRMSRGAYLPQEWTY